MRYDRRNHAAKSTSDYVFNQLIPYIGNKRKLLDLIASALAKTELDPHRATFVDAFAGSGVVSRWAKRTGYRVLANDWEPYAEVINSCYVACNASPTYFDGRSYTDVLEELNELAPKSDWITRHLCPDDDDRPDVERDRMFYMRKNGRRIDAIRCKIQEWERAGLLTVEQKNCLLAPLLYQACYTSNTSGVFKGFHNGWGGQTKTALYRIASDLCLAPAVFHDNGRQNLVFREDATRFARQLAESRERVDVVYLDPPYNQHPYGSNYHVLNTLTLWDRPALPKKITGRGDKSAIRLDWRSERRSAYNQKTGALAEYRRLLDALDVRWIAASYSTDGNMALDGLLEASQERGNTRVFARTYKRYRVSSQRFSEKPLNVEFVLLTDTTRQATRSADALCAEILAMEKAALEAHPESQDRLSQSLQSELF